jgi:hypothetical protein
MIISIVLGNEEGFGKGRQNCILQQDWENWASTVANGVFKLRGLGFGVQEEMSFTFYYSVQRCRVGKNKYETEVVNCQTKYSL